MGGGPNKNKVVLNVKNNSSLDHAASLKKEKEKKKGCTCNGIGYLKCLLKGKLFSFFVFNK